MDLKEYLQIIKKHKNLFIFVILFVSLGVFAYYSFRPVSFVTSLTIDVSRIGFQETTDYRYDDFYRLQADEKFCETIVEWLKNPRVVADIFKEAGIDTEKLNLKKLSASVKAQKRSSQIVAINFGASDEKTAKKIANAIIKIISKKTEVLNANQKENTWFQIFSDEPVIKENKINWMIILAGFLAGIFLAFWTVLIKHYLE